MAILPDSRDPRVEQERAGSTGSLCAPLANVAQNADLEWHLAGEGSQVLGDGRGRVGSDRDDEAGVELTYANRLETALSKLGVRLVL